MRDSTIKIFSSCDPFIVMLSVFAPITAVCGEYQGEEWPGSCQDHARAAKCCHHEAMPLAIGVII